MADPTTVKPVPLSGNLADLSAQLGMSQADIIAARRAQINGITGAEGNAGQLEQQSFAERSALPATGTPTGTSDSYWDANRGVQVYAPTGSYFQLFSGGGVRTVQGSAPKNDTGASSLFTQGTQAAPGGGTQATPGFKQENLGYQAANGKTIAKTGQTIFNPATGVDVPADPGNVWITYTDGTVEQRPFGGAPGTPQAATAAGKTADQLGITSNTGIKDQQGNQLPINHVQQNPQNPTAGAGVGGGAAGTAGPSGSTPLNDPAQTAAMFKATFGRTPNANELNYWEGRTDKSGNALAGAMQFTKEKGKTIGSPVPGNSGATQGPTDTLLSQHGFSSNPSAWMNDPIGSVETAMTTLLNNMGVPTINAQLKDIMSQQSALNDKLATDTGNINSNPWLTEGERVNQIKKLTDVYDQKKQLLTSQQTLYQNLYDKAVQQAQYITTTAINEYNAEATRQQNELNAAATRAIAAANAQATAANSNFKDVQGGLLDLAATKKNGKPTWAVPPIPTTKSVSGKSVLYQYDPNTGGYVAVGGGGSGGGSGNGGGGIGSATIVNPSQDAAVQKIIAANPNEWGHAADAIDKKFGKGTATLYDAQLKAVYQDGQSVKNVFNQINQDNVDPVTKAYADSIMKGNATMQQVPAKNRNAVALYMDSQQSTDYSPMAMSRLTMSANRIVDNFIKLPQYQLTANGLPYLQRIDAAMKNPGSVSDQDLLDSLTKLNTAGNAISDAQVRLVTDGRSYADTVNTFQNKFKNGGVLSDNQRQQLQAIANGIFDNYKKGYQPVYNQVTSQLQAAGIPRQFWTIPDLNNLSAQAQGQSGGQMVIAPDGTQIMITN